MITTFKRIVVLLCITTLPAIVGMGCNTAHGFGKDVSNAGQGIQNGSNHNPPASTKASIIAGRF